MIGRFYSFCLATTAFMLIFFAGRFGIANLYAVGLEQIQYRWTTTGIASEPELKNSSILTQQMLRLHADHPHYISLAASQAQWFLLSENLSDWHQDELLSVARNYFRSSIQQRPTWPDSYAKLAKLEWILGTEPDLLFQLVSTAKRFGPFNPTVLYSMAEVGLANWSILSSKQRMEVFDSVLQGMNHYKTRPYMEQILTSPLNQDNGCRLLALMKQETVKCGVREI